MRFNSFYGTLFAICLTALIFATLVGGLCIIRHIETRRARREETATHMPPPAPSPYGIDLPTLNTPDDFRASDETLVEPVVSARRRESQE